MGGYGLVALVGRHHTDGVVVSVEAMCGRRGSGRRPGGTQEDGGAVAGLFRSHPATSNGHLEALLEAPLDPTKAG